MKGIDLLEKMELIDPAYVDAADAAPKKRSRSRWGALAACIFLTAAAVTAIAHLLPKNTALPAPPPVDLTVQAEKPAPDAPLEIVTGKKEEPAVNTPEETVPEQTLPPSAGGLVIRYNQASAVPDAAKRYIPGYFTEALSEEELAAVLPDRLMPDMELSGYAGFDAEGDLLEVVINADAHFRAGAKAAVIFSGEAFAGGYLMEGEPAVSRLNGHDFTVYAWSSNGSTLYYDAFGEIGGYSVRISYVSDGIPQEEAVGDFVSIADCFTAYADGRPDLSAIKADEIPEFFDRKLTHSEAQADPDFGAYLPETVPAGFAEESVRRYKDQNYDYLSGLWTKGYDELRWQVSYYRGQDADRLTGIGEPENYDLSLYPIPRADSVPEELRRIVDDPIFSAQELTLEAVCARAYKTGESGDSSGWRMSFSVKYGDILVFVRAKGVEPEWLYQQLMQLSEH